MPGLGPAPIPAFRGEETPEPDERKGEKGTEPDEDGRPRQTCRGLVWSFAELRSEKVDET